MRDSDVIEQAARVLSRAWGNMSTNDSLGRQRMLACALADAGLLARPLPDREQIAGTIAGRLYTTDGPRDLAPLSFKAADAVLALMKGQDQ